MDGAYYLHQTQDQIPPYILKPDFGKSGDRAETSLLNDSNYMRVRIYLDLL
jgi:hypothetical protein